MKTSEIKKIAKVAKELANLDKMVKEVYNHPFAKSKLSAEDTVFCRQFIKLRFLSGERNLNAVEISTAKLKEKLKDRDLSEVIIPIDELLQLINDPSKDRLTSKDVRDILTDEAWCKLCFIEEANKESEKAPETPPVVEETAQHMSRKEKRKLQKIAANENEEEK